MFHVEQVEHGGAPTQEQGMYISVVKDGHGGKNQYVLLKESYRTPDGKNRSRVVRNFGNLEKLREGDPDALEKLKALNDSL